MACTAASHATGFGASPANVRRLLTSGRGGVVSGDSSRQLRFSDLKFQACSDTSDGVRKEEIIPRFDGGDSTLLQGVVSEAKVDAFNMPFYSTSPNELRKIIEENGCFSIERMEILNKPNFHNTMPDIRQRTLFMRASMEMLIEKHFGAEIIDHLFEIYTKKLSESFLFLNPHNYHQSDALFVLLKNNVH